VRSSLVFSGNIRGALEEAIREAREGQANTIYLGRIGPYNKGGLVLAVLRQPSSAPPTSPQSMPARSSPMRS
jgi:hypothetical protein